MDRGQHPQIAPRAIVGEVELALFARDPRLEDDLEEEVTQLLAMVSRVARFDGLDHLVGFLEEVGSERAQALLAIPGTTARVAQPVHDLEQPRHRDRGFGLIRHRFALTTKGGHDGRSAPRSCPRRGTPPESRHFPCCYERLAARMAG